MWDWRAKVPAVYILASKRNGILYIGVTGDLADRMAIHKQKLFDGFTKKYGVGQLVYYEMHETMEAAILRETQLKKWKRAWKVRLIEQMNRSGLIFSTRGQARSWMALRIGRGLQSDGHARGWPPARP